MLLVREFEVRNYITLTITICIALFEAIGELHKKDYVMECSSISQNGQTCDLFLQLKS